MKKRFAALMMAMSLSVLVLSAGFAHAAGEDTVTFKFVLSPSLTSVSTLDKSFASVSVASNTTVNFNDSYFSMSKFGYQFVSATPSSYTGTGNGVSVAVQVAVKLNYWPGFPGPPTYPFESYSSGAASSVPDMTVTAGGVTYTIPGWMVYEWINSGTFPGSANTASTLSGNPGIYAGGQLQITSAMLGGIDPNSGKVFFRSSNTRIATVTKNGLILGISYGTARITAVDARGHTYGTWEIVVNARSDYAQLTLNKNKVTMRRSGEYRLTAYLQGLETDVIWHTSNAAIATVNNGFVTTYERKGKATITATLPDGSTSARCAITVR